MRITVFKKVQPALIFVGKWLKLIQKVQRTVTILNMSVRCTLENNLKFKFYKYFAATDEGRYKSCYFL